MPKFVPEKLTKFIERYNEYSKKIEPGTSAVLATGAELEEGSERIEKALLKLNETLEKGFHDLNETLKKHFEGSEAEESAKSKKRSKKDKNAEADSAKDKNAEADSAEVETEKTE